MLKRGVSIDPSLNWFTATVSTIGSARRPRSAPAATKGLQEAGLLRRKNTEAKTKKTGVKRYAGAYSYSVKAKKTAAQRSARGFSRPMDKVRTPNRTRFGSTLASVQRESMMCHGEIARRKVARSASVLSPVLRTRR